MASPVSLFPSGCVCLRLCAAAAETQHCTMQQTELQSPIIQEMLLQLLQLLSCFMLFRRNFSSILQCLNNIACQNIDRKSFLLLFQVSALLSVCVSPPA